MIVVTGATGQYGRKVVEGLLRKVPASEIGVCVRDPEKAADLAAQGVQVSQANFAEPATLAAPLDGAEQVLIVSVNVPGEEAVRLHGEAIQAAKDAGVRRILYTSHQAASPASQVAFARNHAATEALLEASGLPFVSLRNGFYAESCVFQLGGVRDAGKLSLPEDGPVSWTGRDDLALAAVAALTDTSLFAGVTAPLTGARTYTFAEVAQLASDVLGRPVVRQVVSIESYGETLRARGLPEPVIGLFRGMFQAMRDGEFDRIDPTLERVLGRKPASLEDALQSFFAPDRAQ